MAPVPAPKKFWIFDGTVEQYPSVLSSNSVHMGKTCVDCHGGDATKNTREAAHSGDFEAIPGSSECVPCHQGVVDQTADGLHTTLAGYDASLAARGFGSVQAATAHERFDAQCTKCHVATTGGQSACGFCHVSVPNTAGGGLLKGHAFQQTPSTDNNCTACHGSRVKDEYYGQNNALLERNKAAYDTSSPFEAATFTLQPDVHKTNGMDCVACHQKDEMHGVGAPTGDDRYAVTTSPACGDCHGAGKADAAEFAAVSLHSSRHLDTMDCYVCHAQPYKNCFSCHTDVTVTGVPFFKNNGDDPTLAARKAAAADPTTVAPDALMTFRAGINPKWTGDERHGSQEVCDPTARAGGRGRVHLYRRERYRRVDTPRRGESHVALCHPAHHPAEHGDHQGLRQLPRPGVPQLLAHRSDRRRRRMGGRTVRGR